MLKQATFIISTNSDLILLSNSNIVFVIVSVEINWRHYIWSIPYNYLLFFFCCSSRKILEPAQTCDILKGIIIVISCCILSYLDISMMYHIIRGQAVLKLYVFYNIVEVSCLLICFFFILP